MRVTSETVNGHSVQMFEGPVVTTYAVYPDNLSMRCLGTFDTYGEAVAFCWGLPVVDLPIAV
jgi:hypothetical protein